MGQIGEYLLIKEEERGSLGKLFLAEHTVLKRRMALKRLPVTKDREFVSKVQEKIVSLAKLEHPCIARLQNACFEGESCYVAYDWASSSEELCLNLHDYVEDHILQEEEIFHIANQIASSLDYLHSCSIAHLGIKASNILLDFSSTSPCVMLSDTGLASLFPPRVFLLQLLAECSKELGSDVKLSSFWETFYSMAPEYKEGKPCLASDVYSFGVLLYRLLLGKFPQGKFPLPSEVRHKLQYAYAWDALLSKCLDPDPEERPKYLVQSLENMKMKKQLVEAIQGESSSTDTRPHLKINPGEIHRPVFDADPGSVFHIENAIVKYRPEPKENVNMRPIDTEMIVINGGEFWRGSSLGARDETPKHQVLLSSFALDRHPVTNDQFIRFLEVMGGERDGNNNEMIRLKDSRLKKSGGTFIVEAGYHKHPVVGVSWYGAYAYAKWVGKRLPTEAEWEVAAIGPDKESIYPSGTDIKRSQANFFSSDTTPVMSYPPNEYQLYDMSGNVYEWCQDWYDYHYYDVSAQEPKDPKGPVQGVYRVLRGGCWKSLKEDMRCSHRHRNNPGTMDATYGFRCAADVSYEGDLDK